MTPPPLPACLVGGGLALNVARWHANKRREAEGLPAKTTICRWWIPLNKPAAIGVAVGFGTWLVWHVATYVIDP